MVANEHPISGGKPHQPTAVPGDESRPIGIRRRDLKLLCEFLQRHCRRRVGKSVLKIHLSIETRLRLNELVHEYIKKSSNA